VLEFGVKSSKSTWFHCSVWAAYRAAAEGEKRGEAELSNESLFACLFESGVEGGKDDVIVTQIRIHNNILYYHVQSTCGRWRSLEATLENEIKSPVVEDDFSSDPDRDSKNGTN
jgi:hypothetical protein